MQCTNLFLGSDEILADQIAEFCMEKLIYSVIVPDQLAPRIIITIISTNANITNYYQLPLAVALIPAWRY